MHSIIENAVKNIIPAENINDLHKIALLNSIGKRATSQGVVDEGNYRRYVYFVLRTYVAIGARPQELFTYLEELHNHPSIRQDLVLENYIRKKVASTIRVPSPPNPPEEFLTESTPLIVHKKRWCGSWFH